MVKISILGGGGKGLVIDVKLSFYIAKAIGAYFDMTLEGEKERGK